MFLFLNIGTSELFLIFLVILMFFGSDKIPEIARGLGKGIRQFKDATGSIQREIEKSINEIPEVKKPEIPVVKAPENSVAQKDEVTSPPPPATEEKKEEEKEINS